MKVFLTFLGRVLATIVGVGISLFLFVFILAGIAMSVGSKEVEPIKANSILQLTISGDIVEQPTESVWDDLEFFKDLQSPMSLRTLINEINFAKDDSKIRGIYLKSGYSSPSTATLDEVRQALIEFKKSGKFIYAFGELYTQKQYFLASVADSIFIQPEGIFEWVGLSAENMYLKGLFDKLAVKPNLIRAGKYKSAGETYINTAMSEAEREQRTAYINSTLGYLTSKVAESRKIGVDTLKNYMETWSVRYPKKALEARMIDGIANESEVLRKMAARVGAAKLKDLNTVTFSDYKRPDHTTTKYKSNGNVALIYAVGDIMGGQGDRSTIGSDRLSATIRKAADDPDVKVIVLRINSPGGGSQASDIIAYEVARARTLKPVIISMGDLAASGGYYIAAEGSYIFSEPTTLTGSIGVFAFLPGMKDFWKQNLGIEFDRVKTNPFADFGNLNRDFTPLELATLQEYVDTTYTTFKSIVAKGRKMDIAKVQELAQGRVYTGLQAKELGLVDSLGTLDQAIAYAIALAKVEKPSIRILPEYNEDFSFSSFPFFSRASQVQKAMPPQIATEWNKLEGAIQKVSKMTGVQMYCTTAAE